MINPPSQTWLANWNNQPSAEWTNGDVVGSARGRGNGSFHRAAFLNSLVRGFAKKPSIERLEDVIERAGTIAPQRPLAKGRLKAALKGSSGNSRKVLQALLDWDGSYHRTAADGTVDPGHAIWEEFKAQTVRRVLVNFKDRPKELIGQVASYHLFDFTNGASYGFRKRTPEQYRVAARDTFDALAKRFGTDDVTKWREPRTNVTWTLQGAGAPPAMPFFERGTWEQLVELR